MKLSKVLFTGCLVCLLAVAVVMFTAGPAESNCGSCGKGAKAHKHAVSAGTGYSELQDAEKAGVEAAKQAKKALGKVKPKLVLAFAIPNKFDQAKAVAGVASVFDAKIVHGCSSYNAITESGNAGTIAVLALGGDICVTPVLADLEKKDKEGYKACGTKIGEGLKKACGAKASGKVVVLIGDCHVPQNDNVVKGITGVIGEKIPVVGAAAMGGTTYYQGKVVGKSKNLGILITGNFAVGCSILKEGPADVHANKVVAAAGQAFKDAVGKNKGHTALVFAFDCGGRRGKMGKNRPEELKVMKAVVGKKIPIFGFYGSGEMGTDACGKPSRGVGWHISACALINK